MHGNFRGRALDEILEGTEFTRATVKVLPEDAFMTVVAVEVHAAAFALWGSPNCLSEMPATGEDLREEGLLGIGGADD